MTSTAKKDDNNALNQARAQLKSIKAMVAACDAAREAGDDDAYESAIETIQQDALSVEVRAGWQSPGEKVSPEEYRILLCTGGPAVQIIGDLSVHGEPHTARIQYQDWFTPWTDLDMSEEDESAALDYARQFYFGG